jgi:hypothetical protein
MSLFISKFELRKLMLEEHKFHDGDITLLYISQQLYDINKMYVSKIQYIVLYK